MAHEPCFCCGQIFYGRSAYAYPALVSVQGRASRRIKLMPEHMLEYISHMDSFLTPVSNGQYQLAFEDTKCRLGNDHEAGANARAMFVTLYPKKDVRRDYAGLVCADHADRARMELLLGSS